MEVYSIGFTQTDAARFFGRLRTAGIGRLLDVRLNNTSQLAGWAKRADLPYFLQELLGAEYVHEPRFAPTQALLDAYRKNGGDWSEYERDFLALMDERRVAETVPQSLLLDKPTVLLCSEATAENCHRRLVLEYLQPRWQNFSIVHL
ncbi:MAG: DUF488 domain-containing protein [Akkermansiaceae bacterium]|nr:DUF488 domain-containing protein [Armatimonadota bacterium]